MNTTASKAPVEQLSATIATSEIPGLSRIRALTRGALTKQWPTRHLTLCPPAHGALVASDTLGAPTLFSGHQETALVLFLPSDFEAHLQTLSSAQLQLRTHEIVGFRKREVYLSLSLPPHGAALPMTVWVRAKDVLGETLSAEARPKNVHLPVLMVAGSKAVPSHWTFDMKRLERVDAAIQSADAWAYEPRDDQWNRAQAKAEKYGERPWLFMRYDVTHSLRRFAVNWAPICTIQDEVAVEYKLD